jgi:hypothetical protein
MDHRYRQARRRAGEAWKYRFLIVTAVLMPALAVAPDEDLFQTKEIIMSRYSSIMAVAALSVVVSFAATEMASAQKAKKMTYEEAYKTCQATDMVGVPGETVAAGRTTRAAACMKKYGFRLKK